MRTTSVRHVHAGRLVELGEVLQHVVRLRREGRRPGTGCRACTPGARPVSKSLASWPATNSQPPALIAGAVRRDWLRDPARPDRATLLRVRLRHRSTPSLAPEEVPEGPRLARTIRAVFGSGKVLVSLLISKTARFPGEGCCRWGPSVGRRPGEASYDYRTGAVCTEVLQLADDRLPTQTRAAAKGGRDGAAHVAVSSVQGESGSLIGRSPPEERRAPYVTASRARWARELSGTGFQRRSIRSWRPARSIRSRASRRASAAPRVCGRNEAPRCGARCSPLTSTVSTSVSVAEKTSADTGRLATVVCALPRSKTATSAR